MMIRTVLLILLALNVYSVFGRDIFVGGSGASDSNPGTATQPFATIQKAASVAVAGDVVRIRTGTYRESVVPANSGSGGSPITFMPDAGASVVVSGLNLIDNTGWTVHSGNIYKKTVTLPVDNPTGLNANLTSNTTLGSNQLFKDGNMVIRARWPNAANIEATWDRNNNRQRQQTVTWYDGNLTDNALPGGLVGGTIWIQGWYQAQTKTITGQSGSNIRYPSANPDTRMQQYYYVTGTLSLLDQANEWHYDPASDQLYVWQPGGGAPTGIEYKARNWGFDLRSKTNISIIGLQFLGCEVTGNTSTSNCTIDNARFRYQNAVLRMDAADQGHSDVIFWNVRQTGIHLVGPNNVVKNSEFRYASCQGLTAGPNAVIQNNLFDYINANADYGAAISIYDNADNIKIIGNTIRNTGRSSLDWGERHRDTHTNLEVAYNDMYNWNMLSYDGGAVYGGRQLDLTGTVVHHNWIHDSKAMKVPNLPHSGTSDHLVGICAGIYYDQACGPTTNHHNVMWNNYECDFHTWQWDNERNAGKSFLYNNTFATDAGDNHYSHRSYLTVVTAYFDVMRNNIFRDDVVINWINPSASYGDARNCLMENVDPQFNGTGQGGLIYRLKAGSPGVNAGVAVPGFTDGSVGTPDIGAYEFGGDEWIPGYKPVTVTQPAPPANTPPVGQITSPANNATFLPGANVAINATASDANGSVTKVEFFRGTTKLGEDTTSPYAFTWNNVVAGTYALTVKVTDNGGSTVTSAAVSITVAAATNTPPVVSITAPANNAQVTGGSAVTVSATATDAGGTVAKVEFFDGAVKLGEDTSSPYSFTWNNAATGAHALTAKATDNLGASTTSTAVTITVVAPNGAPVVALTAPANNASYDLGEAITLTANASDPNGTISKVEFFQGSTKLGEDATSPYAYTWSNAPAGSYVLTAKASDNQGSATTSTAVSISVITIATPNPGDIPVNAGSDIELTLPLNNATLTSTTTATQALQYSWTQVQGPSTATVANNTTAALTVSSLAQGTYVFQVTVTDANGGTGSDLVQVVVFAAGGEEVATGEIPRFFSPNNDGNGDIWLWPNIDAYKNAKLTVYNRAGQPVYQASPYLNNWDGKSGGQALQDGDYYYIIQMADASTIRGAVRIVR